MLDPETLILRAIVAAEIAPLLNALDPNLMTAAERLAEVGEILAAGLLRLRAKTQKAENCGDIPLDFPARQSRHGRKSKRRERP